MNFKREISFIAVFLFLVMVFYMASGRVENFGDAYVRIVGVKIKVDIVDEPAEREVGLGGRFFLARDEGMLFIFEHPGKYKFWMRGMKFPIDIIWINETMEVVYIKEDARHETPSESFGPDQDAIYVLEVYSGFADDHDLRVGDKVEFDF